ncbi:hypothetical protein [Mycobacteroides abscessus]|uniref:hypothetical protein n=1 Tax=Mycobacteroides abscessus TaxID=36809 RepID=UPI00092C8B5E|nr:hypothetical protein [Mycobacteroides abscessus]SIE37040.1 Uncharacterised protein [Mycobacteroides abscessus subsp. abscessus]
MGDGDESVRASDEDSHNAYLNSGYGRNRGTGFLWLNDDWSEVNDSDVQRLDDPTMSSLSGRYGNFEKKAINITDETFGDGLKYKDVYNRVVNSNVTKAHDDSAKWHQIASQIETARDKLSEFISSSIGGGIWEGASRDAAVASARAALRDFDTLQKSANVMGDVVERFAHTADETKRQIVAQYDNYVHDVVERANSSYSEHVAEAEQGYDTFAQNVMRDPYRAGIDGVRDNTPNVAVYGSATAPRPIPAPTNTPGSNTPSSTPTSSPGSGSGAPKSVDPKKLVPDKKTTPTNTTSAQSTNPAQQAAQQAAQGATSAAKGATDAAKSAADSAKSALDQGLQSLSSLGDLANGNKSLPEGALGLGPLGPKTADALKGLGGRTGGGSGGRGVSTSVPGARPSATPIEASKTASAQQAAATSRAGIGASGASGGAGGAPAAGSRGAGADSKEHKSNKALRRVQGELFNDAEAVVSVLGAPEEKPQKD